MNNQPGHDSYPKPYLQVRGDFPPGLLGDVAAYIYIQAPYPNTTIALAGAIGILAGIAGRKYNTPTGTGLNQYMLILAGTGRGKEAVEEAASKLISAVAGNVVAGEPGTPVAADYRLPGHFASAEGLIKRLATAPHSGFSIQGEFAAKLKAMLARNASPVALALKAVYLDFYAKSGAGKSSSGMAYSDKDKNVSSIESPAFTLIGESTHELLEEIDHADIASGLIPRFLIFPVDGLRPYLNPYVGMAAPADLIEKLAKLCALCADYKGGVRVGWDEAAKARLAECERLATDYINAKRSNVHAELWNRAYIKALKLASLMAVGINPHFPAITLDMANWAISLVATQIDWLSDKFENGEVGEEAGNEAKQRTHIIQFMVEFVTGKGAQHKDERFRKLAARRIVPYSYIQTRATQCPAFKPKPTPALKQALNNMKDNEEIVELDATYVKSQFGFAPKVFCFGTTMNGDIEAAIQRYSPTQQRSS